MNVFKSLKCSNLILRSYLTIQQPSSLICKLKTSPFEFRQFSSLKNVLTFPALINFESFTPLVLPSCGLKSKGCLQLRCRNCYFERKDGEMYVSCPSYGRHKQVLRRKRNKKFNWILSYAFQSKIRPY